MSGALTATAILLGAVFAVAVPSPPPEDGLQPAGTHSHVASTDGTSVTVEDFLNQVGWQGDRQHGDDGAESDANPTGCEAIDVDPKICLTAPKPADEPDVTLTDLAIFRPSMPALTGDPVGYGLMNAPANIIANAEDQTVTGELFDRPVQVRFVPVQYTFSYGDGATRVSDTGGATWEALGVPQFTPTPTTHAYGARGTYSVSVTVAYAPFVDFGSGWRPVAGTVSATSTGYGIQIVEARTALVAHDCNEDPSGVGCPTR